MRYTTGAFPVALLAAMAVQVLLVSSCSPTAATKAHPADAVRSTREVIAAEKHLWAVSRVHEWSAPGDRLPTTPGSRLPVMLSNLRRAVLTEIADPDRRAQVLSILDQADDLLRERLAPAHAKAMNSRQPADAKAMAPLFDELDQKMDELLRILS